MREQNDHQSLQRPELNNALVERYSCRAYLDQAISPDTLQTVLEIAQRAPTSGNTQPAKIYLLQGPQKREFEAALLPHQQQGPSWYSRDLPPHGDTSESSYLKARRIEVAKGLETATLPGGLDKQQLQAARSRSFVRNYTFFGAPVGLIITVPKIAGTNGLVDIGIYLAHLCLAAQSQGLAACIQGAWWNIRDQVAYRLNIDPTKEDIVVGVSLGYPDQDAAINSYRSPRAALREIVTIVDKIPPTPPATFQSLGTTIEQLQRLNEAAQWGISTTTWQRAREISVQLSDHVGTIDLKKISPPNPPHQWGTRSMTRWVLTPYFSDANKTLSTLARHILQPADAAALPNVRYTKGSEVEDGLYWELIDFAPADARPNSPSVHRWSNTSFPHAGILSATLVHDQWRPTLGTTRPALWLTGMQAKHPDNGTFSDTPYITTLNEVTIVRFENEGLCTPKIVIPELLARVRC